MRFELIDDDRRVDCIAEDGSVLFSIHAFTETSIAVTGFQTCRVAGKLYGGALSISPSSSMNVVISAKPYDES